MKLFVQESPPVAEKVRHPEKIVAIVREQWPGPDMRIQESMVAVFLNNNMDILGIHLHSVGGTTSCTVDPKILFAAGLQYAGFSSLIIAHNHPSGNLNPSQGDMQVSQAVKRACAIMTVNLLDSIIIAPNGEFTSLKADSPKNTPQRSHLKVTS